MKRILFFLSLACFATAGIAQSALVKGSSPVKRDISSSRQTPSTVLKSSIKPDNSQADVFRKHTLKTNQQTAKLNHSKVHKAASMRLDSIVFDDGVNSNKHFSTTMATYV